MSVLLKSAAITPAEIARMRADFPILALPTRSGHDLAYLDWSATAQKPQCVLDAMNEFYATSNGGVNRATHYLADAATTAFEAARVDVANFVGAQTEEIVWCRSATEAINLVASSLLYASLEPGNYPSQLCFGPGDEVVVTRAEHHSNLVPWQELCRRTGASLKWLDLDEHGRIDPATFEVINPATKLVAFTHASNVTGAISDVGSITARAKAVGALTLLDTCQSSTHLRIDVAALDVDFAVFSGHKMIGPAGVGALYGRKELLDQLPAVQTGGGMVAEVTMEKSSYLCAPTKFEAGTQMVAECVGWAKALEYLTEAEMDRLAEYEFQLLAPFLAEIVRIPGVTVLGPTNAQDRLGVVSFVVDGVHPHDVGQYLDARGIAIRVGHHCAQPVHTHFGVRASARASFGPVTNQADLQRFLAALSEVRGYFGVVNA